MFKIDVQKNQLTLKAKEPITSGSVNVYKVMFNFDDAWKDEYKRYAIFKIGSYSVSVSIESKRIVQIPWEIITPKQRSLMLYCGVYGRLDDGTIVLPTTYIELGKVLEGASICDNVPRPPYKSAYDEVLDKLDNKSDGLFYDGNTLSLLSGDKELSSVEIIGGGGDFSYATDEDIQSLFNE